MHMAGQSENKDLVVRLNAVIALLIENLLGSGLISGTRAIEILHLSGMSSTEIAELLGIKASNVHVTMSRIRKQKGTRGKSRTG